MSGEAAIAPDEPQRSRLAGLIGAFRGLLGREAEGRHDHELEFLPAALEIIETPASPVARVIMGVIAAFCVIAVAWATFGQVDIIAGATGKIIPSGKVKIIQPFEIGVVKTIPVRDNQQVRAGELLVELDTTVSESDSRRIGRDLVRARLDVVRLKTLLEGTKSDPFAGLVQQADPIDLMTARQQMQAQAAEQAAKQESIEGTLRQRRAELDGTKASLAKLNASLPIVDKRAQIREKSAENQFGNQIELLNARQALVELQHEVIVQHHRQIQIEQAIATLETQRTQTREEYRRTLFGDLSKAEAQVAQLAQEQIKAQQKVELQTLRAPVDGTVQQLAIHTVGGVVTPAQQLMVIVPAGATLEIEANLLNKDIGFVHPGQDAEVKVEAFNFTRYGLLHGSVVSVSRDSVSPDSRAELPQANGGQAASPLVREPTYVARISLAESTIETEQGSTDLTPGMAVTAEIKTGRRRVIEYLLSPLIRYTHDGLRER